MKIAKLLLLKYAELFLSILFRAIPDKSTSLGRNRTFCKGCHQGNFNYIMIVRMSISLTLLYSEWPKLYPLTLLRSERVLAILSAIGLHTTTKTLVSFWSCSRI